MSLKNGDIENPYVKKLNDDSNIEQIKELSAIMKQKDAEICELIKKQNEYEDALKIQRNQIQSLQRSKEEIHATALNQFEQLQQEAAVEVEFKRREQIQEQEREIEKATAKV